MGMTSMLDIGGVDTAQSLNRQTGGAGYRIWDSWAQGDWFIYYTKGAPLDGHK